MGYLADKYDSAYFLRKDEEGNDLNYGVEGVEAFLKGDLREHDKEILSYIDFSGANVLEFGFGRGETIKHVWDEGVTSYTGVDFSAAACNIATEFLAKFSISGPRIVCADAVEFVRGYAAENKSTTTPLIDVVIMLDFVEHVPRSELREIMQNLRGILSPDAVIVVNTPDFAVDNDVIVDGLDERGLDSSDALEETSGMHCNRYTLESLRQFFRDAGYQPVSRGHYFVLASTLDESSLWRGETSYSNTWSEARARTRRLRGEWPRETFEIAYKVNERPVLHRFEQGSLRGLGLYVVPSYLEYYEDGNYDSFLVEYLAKHDLAGKTVFDLGAFVGVNSMQFAQLVGPNGRVCAFEPNPFNADRLKLNLSENPGLQDRIQIFPLAVANVPGECRFNVHRNVDAGISSASYLDGAHTTLSNERLTELGFSEVNANLVTLDQFVEATGIAPDCIKIDIEGSEHLALAGAINVLRQHRPVLLIELHSIFCTLTSLDILYTIGYKADLLHVEADGRCFIAARASEEVVPAKVLTVPVVGEGIQAQRSELELAFAKAEIIEIKAKLTAKEATARADVAEAKLAACEAKLGASKINLRASEAQLAACESQLSASQMDREFLSGELVRISAEREAVAAQLNNQREINRELREHLNRYQSYLPIRIARKVASLFR